MKAFEFAAPTSEEEALEFLTSTSGQAEVLAGGTDLMGLMKKMIVTPDRVVSLDRVEALKTIEEDSQGVRIGAMVTLEDLLDHPVCQDYPALEQALRGIASLQMQSQGTLGGELCQRPRCWYFRDGHGLLANKGRRVAEGDNRFHAIFANSGPAKFVCPSRLAPALIALGARVRIIGPNSRDETVMPLEYFFRAPKDERQREHQLEPAQIVAQVLLPSKSELVSASYEVQHGSGQDYPLVSAAAALEFQGDRVASARIVLGQVAPTPWMSTEAVESILGKAVTPGNAEAAGQAAVAEATPLAHNEYKVQLAKVAVKRALLAAAGLDIGGF